MAEFRPTTLYRLAQSDPATGYEGEMIFNTTTNQLKVRYNDTWNPVNFGIGGGPTSGTFTFVDGSPATFIDGSYIDFIS